MDETIKQSIVIKNESNINKNQTIERVAFFTPEGEPLPISLAVQIIPLIVESDADDSEKVVDASPPEENSLILLKFTNGNSVENADLLFDGGLASPLRLRNFSPTSLASPLLNETLELDPEETRLFFVTTDSLWAFKVYYLNMIPVWTPPEAP